MTVRRLEIGRHIGRITECIGATTNSGEDISVARSVVVLALSSQRVSRVKVKDGCSCLYAGSNVVSDLIGSDRYTRILLPADILVHSNGNDEFVHRSLVLAHFGGSCRLQAIRRDHVHSRRLEPASRERIDDDRWDRFAVERGRSG